MNTSQSAAIFTEGSECCVTEEVLLSQKLELLKIENDEYKRREQALRALNLTLTQAFANISRSKVDRALMDELKQLFLASSHQTSPETLSELREFYESLMKRKDEQHKSVLRDLESKYKEESEAFKQKLEEYTHQTLAKERELLIRQVQGYFEKEKARLVRSRGKQNSEPRLQHRRKSSSSSTNSRLLSSSIHPLEYSRQVTHLDSESNVPKSSTRSECRMATDIYCNNCHSIFSPNQFASHATFCKEQKSRIRASREHDHNVMQALLKKKEKIESEIRRLVSLKDKSRRRKNLDTELDEIVYVINNRSQLSEEVIQKILMREESQGGFGSKFTKEVVIKRIK